MYFCCLNLLGLAGYDSKIKDLGLKTDTDSSEYLNLPRIGKIGNKYIYGNIAPFFKDITSRYLLLDDIVTTNFSSYKGGTAFSGRLCDLRHPYAFITLFTDGTSIAYDLKAGNSEQSVNIDYEETVFQYEFLTNCMTETEGNLVSSNMVSIIKFKGQLQFNTTVIHGGNKYCVVSCMLGDKGQPENTAILITTQKVGYGVSNYDNPIVIVNQNGTAHKFADGRLVCYGGNGKTDIINANLIQQTFPVEFLERPNISNMYLGSNINYIYQNNDVYNVIFTDSVTTTGFVFYVNMVIHTTYYPRYTAEGYWK